MNNPNNDLKKCTLESNCNLKDNDNTCKIEYCVYQKVNQIIKGKNKLSLIEFIEETEKKLHRTLINTEIFSLMTLKQKEQLLTQDDNFLIDDKGIIFNLKTHKRLNYDSIIKR
jgi:hypothetical protein